MVAFLVGLFGGLANLLMRASIVKTTIRNTKIKNSITIQGTTTDCGRRNPNSLMGRNVTTP